MFLRSLAALASGVLLAGAFEPVGLAVLLPIGLMLWTLVVVPLRPRRAALVSLLFGISFFFTLIFWMKDSVGTGAWLALATVEALFLAPVGAFAASARRHLPHWPWWVVAAWLTAETARSGWPFSGMPWGRLSFAVADTMWAPGLPWYGFTVVSGLICATGVWLGWAVLAWRAHRRAQPARVARTQGPLSVLRERWVAAEQTPVGPGEPAEPVQPVPDAPSGATGATEAVAWRDAGERSAPWRQRRAQVAAGVLLVATVFPLVFHVSLHEVGTARVAVIQGDVPGAGNDLVSVHREVTESHSQMTVDLGARIAAGEEPPVDLVLWPENATAVDPFTDLTARTAIERASAAVDVPILVGGMVDAEDPDHVLNQGIVWEPGVGGQDRYTKQHPVPFGEYIPWRSLLANAFGRLDEVPRDMLSGTRQTPLRAGNILIADAICFDVAYDDGLHRQLRNGGTLAVVQTSNAMFIHTDQVAQQYEMTRLRAKESGRYLPVAAVNGISGIIRPDGSVLTEAEPRTRSTLVGEVALIDTITPAVRLGLWPGRLMSLVTALGVLLLLRRRWLHRRSTPAP